MAVDPADIARLIEMAETLPDAGEFAQLRSLAEMIAYLVAVARAEGRDELPGIELVLSAAELPREMLIEAEGTLRALGYIAVADLLRRFIRRAPKPRKSGRPRTESAELLYPTRRLARPIPNLLARKS